MISFQPTDEEQQLLETVRRFSEDVVIPDAREADVRGEIDPSIRGQYCELGLHLLGIPESLGGIGELTLTSKLLMEEVLANASVSHALALDSAGLGAQAIIRLGSEAQQQHCLPPVLEEPNKAVAFAVSEADLASHTGHFQTRAEKKGGGYVLNGEKLAVLNADRAEHIVVLARAESGSGFSGVKALIVEKDNPGVTVGSRQKFMGLNAAPTFEVIFTDCEVSSEAELCSAENIAQEIVQVLNIGRAINGARNVAVGQAALAMAVDYAQEREAFGKKICQHQGLAFFIVDKEVALNAAQALNYKAISRVTQGKDATQAACLAINYSNRAAVQATIDSIQVFGGAGFMKDLNVERYMRDARTLANVLGSEAEHNEVLGEYLYPAA